MSVGSSKEPWTFALPSNNTPISVGDYVSIRGALITDNPHSGISWDYSPNCIPSIVGWAVGAINPCWITDPANPARWTEIHPPDAIEKLPDQVDHKPTETIRCAALNAHPDIQFLPPPLPPIVNNRQTDIVFDIYPPPNKPPETAICCEVDEDRDKSVSSGQIVTDYTKSFNNYAEVHMAVKSTNSGFLGYNLTPGQFKACYTVSWSTIQDPLVGFKVRQPDSMLGWYNHPVTIEWNARDRSATGIKSCDPPTTYSGPDGSRIRIVGHCVDNSGNVGDAILFLNYDSTPPVVKGIVDRSPDSGGWYNHPVRITWNGTDNLSGLDSCDPVSVYSGPDGANVIVTGHCKDWAGNIGVATVTFDYDSTPPVVKGIVDRSPDSVYGWYNHPLRITWNGTDKVSGLDSCDPVSVYSGPDGVNASVTGHCKDKAGNIGGTTLTLKYDSTPPTIFAPQQNNVFVYDPESPRSTPVNFHCTDATSGVDVCEVTSPPRNNTIHIASPGFHSYTITAKDKAANIATTIVNYHVIYKFAILSPRAAMPGISNFIWSPTEKSIPISFVLLDANNVPVSRATAVAVVDEGSIRNLFTYDGTNGIYFLNLSTQRPFSYSPFHTIRIEVLNDVTTHRFHLVTPTPVDCRVFIHYRGPCS